MKIGRNDPCHCGSGKKYKKCCLDKDANATRSFENPRLTPDVVQRINEKMRKEQERSLVLEKKGILINYVTPIIFKGKKVWALGNQVFHSRPSNETFHEFIMYILKITLGKDWWDSQLALPEEERHFIIQCFFKHDEWRRRNSASQQNKRGVWSAMPDGWSRSLASLAFDIASLRHSNQLPDHLLNRLKNKNEYQGARYEISIAAIFARMDYTVKFLDDEKTNQKHCEFIVKHNQLGFSAAIEVKSRHRKGVLHQVGEIHEDSLLKGDVDGLLREALKQNPGDLPFFVFIDINSPMTPNVDLRNKPWFKDIEKEMESYGKPTPDNPDPFNGIFFTNYSYHYQTENEANRGEHLAIISLHPKFPVKDGRVMNLLMNALSGYGNVPNLDTEENEDLT